MISKTLTIAIHEFKKTVTKKGFIFGTFGLPLLLLFVFGLVFFQMPALISGISESDTGFVDETGVFSSSGTFIQYDSAESAAQAMALGEISGYFIIPADYLKSGKITIYSEKSPLGTGNSRSEIEDFIRDTLVRSTVHDPIMAERIISPVLESEYVTVTNDKTTEEETPIGMMIIPMVLSFMLVFSILTSSGYLLQGIGEEKESRSGELLLSSVSADQLLRGKILGYGGVGFLQMGVWIIMATIVMSLLPFSGLFEGIALSWMFVLTVVYFILGYFLYSISISCTASIASTSAEAQQTSMIFTMFAVIPLILLDFIMTMPDSPVSVVLTYFPYTSPFTIMYRMALENVPVSEIVLSLGILIVSILIAAKLSAKIFRAGMLMYGKKPGLKTVLKFLKN